MFRRIVLLCFALFLLAGTDRTIALGNSGKYVPDQLLVKFKPQTSRERVDSINKAFSCKIIKYISEQHLYLIGIPRGASVGEMINSYQQVPEVEYVEPNYMINVP